MNHDKLPTKRRAFHLPHSIVLYSILNLDHNLKEIWAKPFSRLSKLNQEKINTILLKLIFNETYKIQRQIQPNIPSLQFYSQSCPIQKVKQSSQIKAMRTQMHIHLIISYFKFNFLWKKFSTTKRVIILTFWNLTRCLAASCFCRAFTSA